MFIIHKILLLCLVIANSCLGSHRNLRFEINPGCGKICDDKNVTTFHLRADGPNDTLHYIWDFIGNPSILLAVTSTSAELNIDWANYLSKKANSMNFTEKPSYTFGLSIEKILEFNDINDTGSIDKVSDADITILNPQYFHWMRKSHKHSAQFVELHMSGEDFIDPELNVTRHGNIQIVLNGFCMLEHSDVTPHMLHSENSTQLDFIIDQFQPNKLFSKSRFGMELMMISDGNSNFPMYINTKKSLDDEHTPGIFEVVEIRTPDKIINNAKVGTAYLQWRPVSYTTSHRDVTSSTETMHYRLHNCSTLFNNSMLYAFYGDQTTNLLMEKINITLGASGDGFYKKTSYSTWTVIVGYGIPPDEQFSYLVIMIISIGVGLPIIILSIAAIYSCIRRLPRNRGTRFINS